MPRNNTETVQASSIIIFQYDSKDIMLFVVDGITYAGIEEIKDIVGSVYSSAMKYCSVKKVNGVLAFPVNECRLMRAPYKKNTQFFNTLLKTVATEQKKNLHVVNIKSVKKEVLYKTPEHVFEYLDDLIDESEHMVKLLRKAKAANIACIKFQQEYISGVGALKKVLRAENEDIEKKQQITTINKPRMEWLQDIDWDWLSPANFSKLWGVYDIIDTMNDAEKELNMKGSSSDSNVWMSFGSKISDYANKHGIEPEKGAVSSKVKHKYGRSASTNVFPVWLLEKYFHEHHGKCRNTTYVEQLGAKRWVENTLRKSDGCGAILKEHLQAM